MVMLVGIPFTECRELLGDGLEETNDDTNWGRLHVIAELVDGGSVLEDVSVDAIMTLEFNLQERDSGNRIASPPKQPKESTQA